MHEGNASLIFTTQRPVRLAPLYDMLPMAYRPGSLGQVPGVQETQLGLCSQASAGLERDMALTFWDQLASTDEVSAESAGIASRHVRALAR